MRVVLGWIFPVVAGALTIAVTYGVGARPSVEKGVAAGVTLAALQAYLSMAALRWAWKRPSFWWVWGGGVLFRMTAFAVIAFCVYRFTQFSFVATMTSMVASTTVFLVVESAAILKG